MIGKRTWQIACGAVLLSGLYLLSPYRIGIVCGESMSPTLTNGQPILIDRSAYRNHPPQRGDVVIFVRNGVTYIKRVAAVEGDRFTVLRFHSGGDLPLEPDQARSLKKCMNSVIPPPGRVVVRRMPVGCCYVLGDQQQLSEDSRQFGPVLVEEIRGKLLFAPPHKSRLAMATAPTSRSQH
jgi:signal peptidase I